MPVTLAKTKPDFESILLQFQLLANQQAVWKDFLPTSVGNVIQQTVAAGITFNQAGLEVAAREAFLQKAFRDSSIYAGTRMLGVRIGRKYPASVSVDLQRPATSYSELIPRFTEFNIGNQRFFNRHAIMFEGSNTSASERIYDGAVATIEGAQFQLEGSMAETPVEAGSTYRLHIYEGPGAGSSARCLYNGGVFQTFTLIDPLPDLTVQYSKVALLDQHVTLYQGEVRTENFVSDGTAFKTILLEDKTFSVSDSDIEVTLIDPTGTIEQEWYPTEDGIWVAKPTDTVYYDSTTGDGQAALQFGDGISSGALPTRGYTIRVRYALTKGAAGISSVVNQEVRSVDTRYFGTTTEAVVNGYDEKPSSFYKNMGSQIFKARRRAVTMDDYVAIALDFPGVVSAVALGQRDIAPGDLRWMNVVQYTLLPQNETELVFSEQYLERFNEYMEDRKHGLVHIVHLPPTRMGATLSITVALRKGFSPADVLPIVEANIRRLFARREDTLGRRIVESDVIEVARIEGVDYIDVTYMQFTDTTGATGAVNLIPTDKTHYVALDALNINTKFSERTRYDLL